MLAAIAAAMTRKYGRAVTATAKPNAELIAAGFYRIVQPRRFGGYEFDVPTFYRVMMEVARGCAETRDTR